MILFPRPDPNAVLEADLHAFVDEQILGRRRALIEEYLNKHPIIRVRTEKWRQQNALIRNAFSNSADEFLSSNYHFFSSAHPLSLGHITRTHSGRSIDFDENSVGKPVLEVQDDVVTRFGLQENPKRAIGKYSAFSNYAIDFLRFSPRLFPQTQYISKFFHSISVIKFSLGLAAVLWVATLILMSYQLGVRLSKSSASSLSASSLFSSAEQSQNLSPSFLTETLLAYLKIRTDHYYSYPTIDYTDKNFWTHLTRESGLVLSSSNVNLDTAIMNSATIDTSRRIVSFHFKGEKNQPIMVSLTPRGFRDDAFCAHSMMLVGAGAKSLGVCTASVQIAVTGPESATTLEKLQEKFIESNPQFIGLSYSR